MRATSAKIDHGDDKGQGGHVLPSQVDTAETDRKLAQLPPEIGIMLVVVGIGGLILPGPVGSPFLIAGGVALWPRAFGRVDHWYQKRFPKSHAAGMRMIGRFIADLETRYPHSLRPIARR